MTQMWKRSFVATTIAIGGTTEDALGALDHVSETEPLVTELQAPHRAARAAALAKAIRDIVFALDERTLR
jgi:hypothetical protein